MPKRETALKYIIRGIIFLAVYFAAGKFGLSLAVATKQVTTVWPPTGIALAFLLLFGEWHWPAVFIGAFLVNITAHEPALAALGIAIGNTLEALLGAYLARKVAGLEKSIRRLKDAVGFTAFGVLFGPAVSATFGALTLAWAGLADWQALGSVWITWLVGDAMGALVVAPLILSFADEKNQNLFRKKPVETFALFGLLVLASLFVFTTRTGDSLITGQLKFLVFPFLLWAALAFSQLGVSIALLLITGIAITGTIFGLGPFMGTAAVVEQNLILLQIFMFTAGVSGLLLAAAVEERDAARGEAVEGERRYRQLVELSPDAMFIERAGRFVFVNSATLKLFGARHQDDLLGQNVADFIHPDYLQPKMERLRALAERKRPVPLVEEKILRLDGLPVDVETASTWLIYKGNPAVQVIMRDIRERKDAERRLRISMESVERERAKDEALLESIAEGVVAIDTVGRVIYINDQAEELFGFTERELLGKVFNEIVPAEDEKGVLIPISRRALSLAVATKKRSPLAADFIIRKDRTKVPVHATASPVILEGRVVGAIGTYRDITKEKEIERAKSEFVSVASHQLRSPLTAFKWVIELLRKEKVNRSVRTKIEYLYKSNDRLITLVNDLLSVSRIEVGTAMVNKQPSDVKGLIGNVIGVLTPDAEAKKVTVRVQAKIDVIKSVIDPNLFSEAFKNILDNAIWYGPPSSEVKVMIDQRGKEYLISVHNAGPSILEKDKPKLFTKFYRGTGAADQKPTGSGLGLFIAKSAIESNGGKIWFESAAGRGTTFYFTVPITA